MGDNNSSCIVGSSGAPGLVRYNAGLFEEARESATADDNLKVPAAGGSCSEIASSFEYYLRPQYYLRPPESSGIGYR